ncbi:Rieske 2Fe-2S domain-containing protein [Jatrophihabitans sp.]|uniref:cytochrome bc1 complex Rieske iron-sulfur subunit n=1 Tax=Jatrophihabitans sp. TaxID=1932789 RepID=UPI0030C68039|nr:Rieske (2Fe-2S) iron-sulfur domain protein [Jatrophihabitans sp.]
MSDETPGSVPLDPGAPDRTDGGEDRLGYTGSRPASGQTSYDAAGSIRDRLRNPGPQSSGGDTRGSEVSVSDFEQSDSRGDLLARRGDEAQRHDAGPHDVGGGAGAGAADHNTGLSEPEARRAERRISALFLLSLIGTIGFIVVYFFWDFTYGVDKHSRLYTPLLGISLFLALAGIGAGAVVWAKTLMEDEEVIQERHPFGSKQADRDATVVTLKEGAAKAQLGRRPLLRGTLLLSVGALAVLPLPLALGLGKFQHKERALNHTGWKAGVRLIRKNGSPVNRNDLEIGSVESVFPDIPRGTKMADTPALLIRMLPEELHPVPGREDWSVDGFIVYSAICSHLGCPVKLYEQQTHHLLCPCHQSTFAADRGAKVLFGPAARPLSQLAIRVDEDGYFYAQGDFSAPVGPSYWERKP